MTSPASRVPYQQRRDHRPEPHIDYVPARDGGTVKGDVTCRTCGEVIRSVYNRSLPVSRRVYWRHIRRWHVAPWA